MAIPSRDLTDSERPAAPERRHPAEVVGPHRGTWYGHCLCGWRHPKNADRSVVRDAVDAHLVFHHDTGSYMCGRAWCTADRAIKRIRAARELPERFTSAAWRTESRLRNLGTLPQAVVPRPDDALGKLGENAGAAAIEGADLQDATNALGRGWDDPTSAVAMMTGLSPERLAELGGVPDDLQSCGRGICCKLDGHGGPCSY